MLLFGAWGARVVVTPTNVEPEDPRSYYSVAKRLVEETPTRFTRTSTTTSTIRLRTTNTRGPSSTTRLMRLDVFIGGMGMGGTITGVGKYLKEQNPDIKVVGVDPVGSLYYDYFHTGQLTQPHTYVLEGIGEDFLPGTMDFQFVDDVIRVNDRECFQMTRRLVREEGLYVGGSCGAAVAGALKYLKRHDRPGLTAVVLLPDSSSKYLSKIFNDGWMRENGFLDPETRFGTVSDLIGGRSDRTLVTIEPTAR